jgi:hypothetical protein
LFPAVMRMTAKLFFGYFGFLHFNDPVHRLMIFSK